MLEMEQNGQLFVDTALLFGLHSPPMIFNALAEAMAYIIWQKGVQDLDHYLDDFAIVGAPMSPECGGNLTTALDTCEETGFPVVMEKTENPATKIILLGVELDSELLQLRLPQGKLEKLRVLVDKWRRCKSVSYSH